MNSSGWRTVLLVTWVGTFACMLAVAVSHFLNLPTWIQVSAALAATVASVYAIRLSRLNIKKTNAELKILRAKAAHLGINIDD